MTESLAAIYEDGVFRPLTPPTGLRNHRLVMIAVSTAPERVGPPLDLVGSIPREGGEEMLEIIHREFSVDTTS